MHPDPGFPLEDDYTLLSGKRICAMAYYTNAKVSLTLDQVLEVIKQLPAKAKLRVAKELERSAVEAEWDFVFKAFKARELSMAAINEAVEAERSKAYARREEHKAGR